MPEQGTSHVLLAALHPASTRLLGERLATTPKDDISGHFSNSDAWTRPGLVRS